METNRGTCKTYIMQMTHGNDVAEKGNSKKAKYQQQKQKNKYICYNKGLNNLRTKAKI